MKMFSPDVANDSVNTSQQVNASGSPDIPFYPKILNIVAILTPMYWILAAMIILLNGALLFLYVRHRTVRLSLNGFIVNQIVTDLQVGLVNIPVTLLLPRQRLAGNSQIPDGLCVIGITWPSTVANMVLWGVAIVAVDRLVAVLRPANYKFIVTRVRCAIVVGSVWIFLIFFNLLPMMNLQTLGGFRWRHYCSGLYNYPVSYLYVTVGLQLVLPILVISLSYICMYFAIKRKQEFSVLRTSGESGQQSLKKAITAAKTCLFITAFISVGWLPFLVNLTVIPIYTNVSLQFRIYSFGITILLSSTVSAGNPIVYFVRSKSIQSVVWEFYINRRELGVAQGGTFMGGASNVVTRRNQVGDSAGISTIAVTEVTQLNPANAVLRPRPSRGV